MGLFNFKKKKAPVQKQQTQAAKTNSFGERLDRLTPDGELPWGWIYNNNDFVNRISGEYSYFLNMWLDSRNKAPKEQYQALKSFVMYLDDAGKLCKSKGECFEWWFYNDLISPDYINKRKKDLYDLANKIKEH